MRYYIIAGEASGDLHGSNLVKALLKLDTKATVRAWGGDLMQAAGADVVKHYRDLAFMGFTEVLANLPTILNNFTFCKKDILAFEPDVLVLIDYPGFNLRIAKWAKQQGLKVIYYISPQVWAWKEGRTKSIKENVDKMLVILPFEEQFYKKWDYKVQYVGHPLVQVVQEYLQQHPRQKPEGKPVVALLPGSRRQEIARKLPIMLQVAQLFPQYQFVVAKASSLDDDFYNRFLQKYPTVASVKNQTYNLLTKATAALVTSGTATLETALFDVPQVVCYKGSSISYQIAKRLVRIKYISLVNLIMDKKIVTELIQDELNVEQLKRELSAILKDEANVARMHRDYADLRHLLQQESNASARAAREIVGFLQANGL